MFKYNNLSQISTYKNKLRYPDINARKNFNYRSINRNSDEKKSSTSYMEHVELELYDEKKDTKSSLSD